jgi:hypothetical protein
VQSGRRGGVSSLGHRDLLRLTGMTIFLLRLKFCHDFSQVPDGHGKWLLTVLYPVRIESRADGG